MMVVDARLLVQEVQNSELTMDLDSLWLPDWLQPLLRSFFRIVGGSRSH